MTHEQLVEKVARIITDGGPIYGDPDKDARAILSLIADALGEPTPAMLIEGIASRHEAPINLKNAWDKATVNIWRAMLDASPLKAGDSHKRGDGV